MQPLIDLIQQVFATVYNVPELIRLVGLIGLIVIVFAETGLLIGFFLPGDSLLITAGLFAARGDFDIVTLNLTLVAAAIIGDATGYWIGRRTGQALYSRPDSLLFRREHLRITHEYYERHGGKTIVIARFIPIVRTFAPVVAGVAEMGYRNFARLQRGGWDSLGLEHDARRLPARQPHPGHREPHPHRRRDRDLPVPAAAGNRLAARDDGEPASRDRFANPAQVGIRAAFNRDHQELGHLVRV